MVNFTILPPNRWLKNQKILFLRIGTTVPI